MKWQWLLQTTALLVSPLSAIFTDDAFNNDYHQALLGIPQSHTTFFHKPQSSSNASLLYTISDKGVLGAVNPKDGSLVWRQTLQERISETAVEAFLAAGDADGRITSGFQSVVSSWDALDGRMIWSHDFGTGSVVKGVQAVPTVGRGAENIIQDIIAVAGSDKASPTITVTRLAGDGAAPRWEYQDRSASRDSLFTIATSPKFVYYITKSAGVVSGSKAKVVVIDINTGKETSQHSVTIDSESLGNGNSLSAGSGSDAPFLLSTEKPYKSIKFNLLGSTKSTTVTLDDKGEEIKSVKVHYAGGPDSARHFLVHVQSKTKHWAEVFHITKDGDVKKAYSLPATSETSVFTATSVGPATYFARITDSEVSLYSSESHGHIGRWPRTTPEAYTSSPILHAATEVSTRGVGGIALRIALSSSETGWSLIRNGEPSWTRPEMLAYITKAVWSEDAQSIALAHDIEIEAASNPISAYVHRWSRHLQDLKNLPLYLINLPRSASQSSSNSVKSTREKLAGSKLILASTSRGEVFALDATSSGAIRWRTRLTKEGVNNPQVVHLSAEANRLTAYLADGRFIVIDTAHGQILDTQKSSKAFGKIVELPGRPASTIVRVSEKGKPEVFSDLAPAVPTEGNVIVTINEQGKATGWSIGSSVEQIWTLQPDNGARITDVVARDSHDPVASIGQVLGDRSVLYKYINPNLALLTAFSPTALTVYVINAVTGAVLHTATHKGVLTDLPISVVAFGHKFVYSFTQKDPDTSGLVTEVIVSELYESQDPNDRGLLQAKANYSSFSPDAGANPYVQSMAFTVAEPLSHLAVSQTIQGITARQVIGYLADSHAIAGIPSEALNARRPVDRDPTGGEVEEGLFKYSPILELDPKYFLSHSREVLGIQKLMTAPTLLESTSLVFAFGHDIFGTTVAPSNTFDVLGKGFKRFQLVLTVVALYAGVLAIRPIARRKIVERLWS